MRKRPKYQHHKTKPRGHMAFQEDNIIFYGFIQFCVIYLPQITTPGKETNENIGRITIYHESPAKFTR